MFGEQNIAHGLWWAGQNSIRYIIIIQFKTTKYCIEKRIGWKKVFIKIEVLQVKLKPGKVSFTKTCLTLFSNKRRAIEPSKNAEND